MEKNDILYTYTFKSVEAFDVPTNLFNCTEWEQERQIWVFESKHSHCTIYFDYITQSFNVASELLRT